MIFVTAMNQSIEHSKTTFEDVWSQRPRHKLQRSKGTGDSSSEMIGSEGTSWIEPDFSSSGM